MAGEAQTPLPVRPSDEDRERLARALGRASSEGRISLETLSDRLERSMSAATKAELAELARDTVQPGWLGRTLARWTRAASALAAELSQAWQEPHAVRLPPPAGGRTRLTIGRSRDCDLVLSDSTVSRHHAELRRIGPDWLLADSGSTNGTRLNGLLVAEPTVVRPGDSIELGAIPLRVTAHRPR
jgi:FHA domain/Domain of unknown function (DUF1707)